MPSANLTASAPDSYTHAVVSPRTGQTITAHAPPGVSGSFGPSEQIELTRSTLISLRFACYHPATFSESGLGAGATWSITIAGHTESNSANGRIVLGLTNGTMRSESDRRPDTR
jgi:hypothetical protein